MILLITSKKKRRLYTSTFFSFEIFFLFHTEKKKNVMSMLQPEQADSVVPLRWFGGCEPVKMV